MPRDSIILPMEAEVIPLPRLDMTPPVMNIYFAILSPSNEKGVFVSRQSGLETPLSNLESPLWIYTPDAINISYIHIMSRKMAVGRQPGRPRLWREGIHGQGNRDQGDRDDIHFISL